MKEKCGHVGQAAKQIMNHDRDEQRESCLEQMARDVKS
jgi:hypothetical protein